MLRSYFPPKRYSPIADILVILLLGTVLYGIVSFGREWRSEFHPAAEISLSLGALPVYSVFSVIRACAAYALSLSFTLVMGYWAAKSKWAERIIIPVLDILQSIPVLGFLPGLVLGLIAIFPKTNAGLELAAVIMIFTGQVWNMTFSYYSSLKSVPADLTEASAVMGMTWWRRLLRLELPFSAVGLAWNSLMSMAGGWFFLSVCEAFTLGDRQYRLPGLGAYMAVAIEQGNTRAMILGVATMVSVIVLMDLVIWRPVLAWVHRFRLEEVPGESRLSEPLIQLVIRHSYAYGWMKRSLRSLKAVLRRVEHRVPRRRRHLLARPFGVAAPSGPRSRVPLLVLRGVGVILGAAAVGFMFWKLASVARFVLAIPPPTWVRVLDGTLWTLLRVFGALILSSAWAVPAGIWIGMSPDRVRKAQPVIQVLASFPAPMLYPLALAVFLRLGVGFDVGSMFLMLLGVQWYVLFNVLAGAMRIPLELQLAVNLMDTRARSRWLKLYLPSVFPALVTGWVTAAGGAWNASIVAEYLSYHGETLVTRGLGATISVAASTPDFELLTASLVVMVATVVVLNRTLWAKIYRLAQTRFRMDL